MSNVFGAQLAIIERIRDRVDEVVTVSSLSHVQGYADIAKLSPAILVRPGGADVPDDPADGMFQSETQRWVVLVCVRSVSDRADEDTPEQSAGVYIYEIIRALIGWRPEAGFKPMRYAGRDDPEYDIGYAVFPVIFETGLVLVGS